MKLERDIVFFDLETTGVDINKDRIVEIAATKIKVNGERIEFYSLVHPQIEIHKSASDVHGITFETVLDAPTFFGLSNELFDFIRNCDLAGYNSNYFDVPILFRQLNESNLFIDWEYNLLDVLKFERFLTPNTLSEVYKRRIGKELENAHSAQADINATIDIFLDQMRGRNESIKEIDLMLQGDQKRVDISGKLYTNESGLYFWSFGKNKDKEIFSDINYLNWVMSSDFPEETKKRIEKIAALRNKKQNE